MRRSDAFGPVALAIVLFLAAAGMPSHGAEVKTAEKPLAAPTALGTSFLFQGQLNGYNGNYDFRFIVYDQPAGGARVAGTPILLKSAVAVTNGAFRVPLDFGAIFGTTRLYVNIEVKPAGSTAGYTAITPRQELLPAPQAYSALNAKNVTWSGVSNKPASLFKKRIYVPAAGWGRYGLSTNITVSNYGLKWKNSTEVAGFVVPKPDDWDPNTTFTVSIYFALPLSSATRTAKWRLYAGSAAINLPSASAATGWDSLDYRGWQDAKPLTVYAASGHSNMMKVQTFTPKWSSVYYDWYFGAGLTVADSYIDNPIWHFQFTRGAAAGNGETFTDDMEVVGASIDYTALK